MNFWKTTETKLFGYWQQRLKSSISQTHEISGFSVNDKMLMEEVLAFALKWAPRKGKYVNNPICRKSIIPCPAVVSWTSPVGDPFWTSLPYMKARVFFVLFWFRLGVCVCVYVSACARAHVFSERIMVILKFTELNLQKLVVLHFNSWVTGSWQDVASPDSSPPFQ